MSEQLGVVCIDIVVDGKLICCLNDIQGVTNKLLWAYHQSNGTLQVSDTGSELLIAVLQICLRPVWYDWNQSSPSFSTLNESLAE